MRIATTKPLFAWDCLSDPTDLQVIKQFFELLPDHELIYSLQRFRGRGRKDHPVHVQWRTMLLGPLLRHETTEATLEELHRNPSLWPIVGIQREGDIPTKFSMSRFRERLGTQPHLKHLQDIFNKMVQRLASVVTDLGVNCAGDATALRARRGHDANPDGLPQPDGGHKEYTDDEGNVTKIVEWFGCKAHLLVDVKHEVIVAYLITKASTADNTVIPRLMKQGMNNLPAPAPDASKDQPPHRIKTLAFDKAGDDVKVHEFLDAHGIKPVIKARSCWKTEQERMLPGHDGTSNIVYDEDGAIYCYDKTSDPPVRRRMAFIGHEAKRRTLKYRCPAMHGGWKCPSHDRCNKGLKYGKTVRVSCDIDLRRFTPIPRQTKEFERLYKGRTSVERANGRLKMYWGADDGNLTGPARFHAFFGAVMVVHAGMATMLAAAPRVEGTLGRMRLSYVARQLRQKIKEQNAA
ncbi:MAG TPA: transposase [Phycisphaerae bacterium]|nr:transposase [Phycisphaerae bacterium]